MWVGGRKRVYSVGAEFAWDISSTDEFACKGSSLMSCPVELVVTLVPLPVMQIPVIRLILLPPTHFQFIFLFVAVGTPITCPTVM